MSSVGVAAGLGCSIVVTLLITIGGGVLLDRALGTRAVFTLIGLALGLAAAAYQLWELANIGNSRRSAGPLARRLQRVPADRAPRSRRNEE